MSYIRQGLGATDYSSQLGVADTSQTPTPTFSGTGTKSSADGSGAWDIVKSIGSGVLNIFGAHAAESAKQSVYQQAAAQRQQPSQTPPWLLPVGIGAAALVLIIALKK